MAGTLDEDIQGTTIGLAYSSTEPLEHDPEGTRMCGSGFCDRVTAHELQEVITYDRGYALDTGESTDLKGFDTVFCGSADRCLHQRLCGGHRILHHVPETQGNQLKKGADHWMCNPGSGRGSA